MGSIYDSPDIYDLLEDANRYLAYKRHWEHLFKGKNIKSMLDISIGSGSIIDIFKLYADKNDYTDYGCISHWKNASGAEDARKIQISISVNRSPENGADPQWQYDIDTERR